MSCHKSICLVLLVGIPSSGKSFFRTYLENYFNGNYESAMGSVIMCSISYDNFEKVKNPQHYLDNTSWKEERLDILKIVRNIVLHFLDGNKPFGNCFSNVTLINGTINKPDCILILIDDNMYYRSMRYEYFKLAKENNVCFCQIFLDVALEKALRSNEQRSPKSQVPDFIIKLMFDKLEPPMANHSWENNSITLSNYADFQNKCVRNKIFSFFTNALLNPPKTNDIDNYTSKELSRQINNSNALHKIDNALKQLTSILIREEFKVSNANKYEISKLYSDKRLALLKQIKSDIVTLPIDFSKPIEEREIDSIKPVMYDLLKDKM